MFLCLHFSFICVFCKVSAGWELGRGISSGSGVGHVREPSGTAAVKKNQAVQPRPHPSVCIPRGGGGGPPCPNSALCTKTEEDKTGAGSVMAASCGSPRRLTRVDNQPTESNTPGCKTLIRQTCLNLSCCTCCCGTFRQQRRTSVLSLSRHLTLKVSHSTTLILHSVHIHKSIRMYTQLLRFTPLW